jgi:hypothetical protein
LAKARLIETIFELFHQDLEAHFARAVARCNSLDFELVMERCSDLLHLLRRRYHEMKAASDGVELRINRGGILQDFLDAWMRASYNDG